MASGACERYPELLGIKRAWAVHSVGGKIAGLDPVEPLKLADLSWREVRGMRGVAVK